MANFCTNVVHFTPPSQVNKEVGNKLINILNDEFLSLEKKSKENDYRGYDIRNFVIGEFAEESKGSFLPIFHSSVIDSDEGLKVNFSTKWTPCPKVIEEVASFVGIDYTMIWYELGNQVIGVSKHNDLEKLDYHQNVGYNEVSQFIEGLEDIDFEGLEDYLFNKAVNL